MNESYVGTGTGKHAWLAGKDGQVQFAPYSSAFHFLFSKEI